MAEAVLQKLNLICDELRIIRIKQHQLTQNIKRNYDKMMSGFKAIEKAFLMNCAKQMEFSESMEDVAELTGILRV